MASSDIILVFGKSGQVASALRKLSPNAVFIGSGEVDLALSDKIIEVLDRHKPRLVINPAAYTNVDKAEADRNLVLKINADAPRLIAEWCTKNGSSLIHFSTDYVYSGDGDTSWVESAPVGPVNYYGWSKLIGEQGVQASGCHHIILRTSWVFSDSGRNFVRTMLALGQSKERLSIVSDQVGSPTFADDLAAACIAISKHPEFHKRQGVYNIANAEVTSWYGFAQALFQQWRSQSVRLMVKEVSAISTADYPTAARRPLNSRLNTGRLKSEFGIELRSWREAMKDCLARPSLYS